eukprot:TRINITY_DN10854_c0_g1_i1.p1 TRINITY_DN10854_c0_g1~~TRINITY_DN10854_c0_g1_i1.p1  ORF type:complete len:287 (-),score=50.16 TRINITY_DN10854_c0_g1_i1:57-917(-)
MAQVTLFHEPNSHTGTYVIRDPNSNKCAVLDCVLDFDIVNGRTSTAEADKVVKFVKDNGWEIVWVLETHAHADHISGAPYIKKQLGGKTAMGERVKEVQVLFSKKFNVDLVKESEGEVFDHLFKEGEVFEIGALKVKVMSTPGHTPACCTYYIENDCCFVGDTIFMPDQGTARCDFPGGDAQTLWNSMQRILALPPTVRLFTCHDYAPGGREYAFESTVGDELASNKHVKEGTLPEEFVKMRADRDSTLNFPRLLIPAIQCNIRGGRLPPAEVNGVAYLKIPLNAL